MTASFYRLVGRLVAETPLHIGSGAKTGVIKHSRSYIPGFFIRGVFGTGLLKLEGESGDLYSLLFAEEFGKASNLFFRYAYPIHMGCDGGVFLPSPKTLYRCSNPQCGKLYDSFDPPYRCEVKGCNGRVKPALGFQCSQCGKVKDEPVPRSRITLTAVDRSIQSSAQVKAEGEVAGTLHVVELIGRGAVFALEVVLDRACEPYLERIKTVLSRCLPDEGIGGSKSRGLGKVSVQDLRIEEVNTEQLEKRVEDINVESFSLKLVSPLILRDHSTLESSTVLEGCRRAYSWCFHEPKPALPEITIKTRRLSSEMISGWSFKTGRRRRVEPAISSGSVVLVESDGANEALARSLVALEYCAIGGYKPHGCGQLKVV